MQVESRMILFACLLLVYTWDKKSFGIKLSLKIVLG